MMEPPLSSPKLSGASPSQGRMASPVDQRGPMRHLLRRVLSNSSLLNASPGRSWHAVSPSLHSRLVPLRAESFGSATSEVSEEDELVAFSSKRQRVSRVGGLMLSPLARLASTNALPKEDACPPAPTACPGFDAHSTCTAYRPPPIHTMVSLEGSDHEVSVISAVPSVLRIPSFSGERGEEGAPSIPGARCGGLPRNSRLGVPNMSLVAPGLFVGDEVAASSDAMLRREGVTHILNCTAKLRPMLEEGGGSYGYLRLNLMDHASDLPRMKWALRAGVDFIRDAIRTGGRVLVHCHRGISRSATLAMAYLIEEEQRPADSVFDTVKHHRAICDPNFTYWCAMKEWETQVLHPAVLARSRSSLRLSPSPRPLSRAG
jgi:hypothetical protein